MEGPIEARAAPASLQEISRKARRWNCSGEPPGAGVVSIVRLIGCEGERLSIRIGRIKSNHRPGKSRGGDAGGRDISLPRAKACGGFVCRGPRKARLHPPGQ